MKMLSQLMIALCLLALLATSSANETLGYCDQRLVQASIACTDSESLESCVVSTLKGTGCNIEIASEDEVDFCNESCTPNIDMDLLSGNN